MKRGAAGWGMLLAVALAYVLVSGHPSAWAMGGRLILAVLGLGLGLAWWSSTRLLPSSAARPARRKMPMDLAVGSVAAGAGGLMLMGYFQWAPEPMRGVAEELETWWRPAGLSRERGSERSGDRTRKQGNWLLDGGKERPLPMEADFKPGNRPELFLQPTGDSGPFLAGKLYVTAFSLHQYRDGTWSAGEGGGAIQAGNDGWLRFGPEAAGGTGRASLAYRVFLGNPGGRQPLAAIHGVQAVRLPELERGGEALWWLPEVEGERDYEAISSPLGLDDLVDGSPRMAVGEAPKGEEWREMPGGALGFRIADLARIVQGEGTEVERLRRIRNHLRTTLDYSLVIGNPDQRDPLENFLFHEQRGHCEFFATAGALLARSAGFASRVSYGWTGGTWYESGGMFVFRAREAHAWAEVWIPGFGWVVMDPTPPTAIGGGRPQLAQPDEEMPVDPMAAEADVIAEATPGSRWLWIAGALLVALVVLMVVRRRRVRETGSHTGISQGELPYEVAFRRQCGRRGVKQEAGATLKELLDRLEVPCPEWAAELVAYHYGVRYEGRTRNREEEKRFALAVRTWSLDEAQASKGRAQR